MSDLWPAARAFEWPAAVGPVQIRPLESEDGPALQELFDGLLDYEKAFGPAGEADAASTYVALPEGATYDDKLLLGLWDGGRLRSAVFARAHGFTESPVTDRSELVRLRSDLSGDRSHGRS